MPLLDEQLSTPDVGNLVPEEVHLVLFLLNRV